MENTDFEHTRFLYAKDGFLHFGCINPFCGHGDPALPNHWKVPMETKAITIHLLSHEKRTVTFEVYFKEGKRQGEKTTITCSDHLAACKSEFAKLFADDSVNRS